VLTGVVRIDDIFPHGKQQEFSRPQLPLHFIFHRKFSNGNPEKAMQVMETFFIK
jgi:hypothetical protein